MGSGESDWFAKRDQSVMRIQLNPKDSAQADRSVLSGHKCVGMVHFWYSVVSAASG